MLILVTPWTVTHQALLSMGFPKQEYWNGLPFPSPGIYPTQGSNPCLLHWQVDSLSLSHLGSPGLRLKEASLLAPWPPPLHFTFERVSSFTSRKFASTQLGLYGYPSLFVFDLTLSSIPCYVHSQRDPYLPSLI